MNPIGFLLGRSSALARVFAILLALGTSAVAQTLYVTDRLNSRV